MEELKDIIKQKLETAGFKEISFTVKGKLEGHDFLLSLYSPKTLHTIFFYKEGESPDDIVVEFISMPTEWKGVRIHKNELDDFIQQFVVASNVLMSASDGPMSTWSREKSDANFEFKDKSAKKIIYFFGYFDMDMYSDLHRAYICSAFMANYCFNEAADKTNIWGSAQYRTSYTTSILNYEGFAISKKNMLYYLSSSYMPSVFNKSRIIGRTVSSCVDILPDDVPVDLVGAFDTIGLKKLFTADMLLELILNEKSKGRELLLEALYFMLNKEEFTKYFSIILDSTNIKIRNAVAERAILWKDKIIAEKVVKKGVSKVMEEKLKASKLI